MNTTPSPKILQAIFAKMAVIKANDEKLIAAMRSGKLMMPYYSARGQECVPAAISVQLTNDDYLVTSCRGIHDMLAKGVPAKTMGRGGGSRNGCVQRQRRAYAHHASRLRLHGHD